MRLAPAHPHPPPPPPRPDARARLASDPPPWTDGPVFWLILYFFFNLGLTLYNKSVLVRFPFPYSLTALHALFSSIGSYSSLSIGAFTPARLSSRQSFSLLLFSFLYTLNIAVSNISLQLVTIPFHQVVRASTPIFTLLLSVSLLGSKFSSKKLMSLLPVMAGVGFATYGDYYFTLYGLLLTLLGTLLASLKTVATNILQSPPSTLTTHGSISSFRLETKLHPLDLLFRMSPLAFIQCVLAAHFTGELDRVRAFGAVEMTRARLLALCVNGAIAFGLNVVSFTANKKTGPLTMTVAANVKQVLTILLAVLIFNLSLSPTNAIGIILTLVGGAWYAFCEYREKTSKSSSIALPSTPSLLSSSSTSISTSNSLGWLKVRVPESMSWITRWLNGSRSKERSVGILGHHSPHPHSPRKESISGEKEKWSR
ncbi:TPT-domain-containing protein [Sistotremastrum suecicum HHB10207 ss-3]|uniref:TPT-domain-containing protein n=1 Tax=Sistotremastrum suecicum HHB10207 ss-3 TaxID=1314776 RepID=A0A166I2K9_9AGAM|nr:TPT-domain-containing protein [Sistotremastrum suecicum HHB10207 ss-3]